MGLSLIDGVEIESNMIAGANGNPRSQARAARARFDMPAESGR